MRERLQMAFLRRRRLKNESVKLMEKESKDESEADDDDKFMVNITRVIRKQVLRRE